MFRPFRQHKTKGRILATHFIERSRYAPIGPTRTRQGFSRLRVGLFSCSFAVLWGHFFCSPNMATDTATGTPDRISIVRTARPVSFPTSCSMTASPTSHRSLAASIAMWAGGAPSKAWACCATPKQA
jgi:hypothetical protein